MSKVIAIFACITFIILAFANPSAFVSNAQSGLLLFGRNVLPILFPFFFISGLLIELDLFKKKSIRIFGLVSLSYLAGFPTSARMLSQLYLRGEITREQAMKTATYTSTTSPIFIIATIGASLYGDIRLGIIIFVSHIAGALINGLFYAHGVASARCHPLTEKELLRQPASTAGVSSAVTNALNSAVQNILAVGGLIIIFFIASAPFPWPIAGILEMTTGVFRASAIANPLFRALIPCTIVSFGGLCVAMQGFVFLKNFHMPVRFYFLYKLTHAIFAVVICFILITIF